MVRGTAASRRAPAARAEPRPAGRVYPRGLSASRGDGERSADSCHHASLYNIIVKFGYSIGWDHFIPGGDVVFPISLRSAMALFAPRSPHAAERNAGTSFVIRDPGFHFVSSGLRWLRSRPQVHCASSTVSSSGPVKKNSWRSWNALSSPRTSTRLDMRILNHSFDIIDRKAKDRSRRRIRRDRQLACACPSAAQSTLSGSGLSSLLVPGDVRSAGKFGGRPEPSVLTQADVGVAWRAIP